MARLTPWEPMRELVSLSDEDLELVKLWEVTLANSGLFMGPPGMPEMTALDRLTAAQPDHSVSKTSEAANRPPRLASAPLEGRRCEKCGRVQLTSRDLHGSCSVPEYVGSSEPIAV